MTTVAIMQPYLFPYIGYYQLVAAVDTFVFLDDVNYIKRGFVNRNTVINGKGQAVRFTLPVKRASQNRHIRDHRYGNDWEKPFQMIDHSYRRSPGYTKWLPRIRALLQRSINQPVSEINEASIRDPLEALGINTRFFRSSELAPNSRQNGEERILQICRELSATRYINLPGGRSLYNHDRFSSTGIELRFLTPPAPEHYDSSGNSLYPSFLHYLMTYGTDAESVGILKHMTLA